MTIKWEKETKPEVEFDDTKPFPKVRIEKRVIDWSIPYVADTTEFEKEIKKVRDILSDKKLKVSITNEES